jgi:hypothetical protein
LEGGTFLFCQLRFTHAPLQQNEDESRNQTEGCAELHDPETERDYLEETSPVHHLFVTQSFWLNESGVTIT